MENNNNLVSIIINVHNGEKYIEKCVQSAINQSYKNIEIIIWNNYSTDNTESIIKNFDDNRIKYFLSDKFEKLYAARNNAIQVSNGDFITFLDCDDSLLRESISTRVRNILKNKSDVCFANLYISKNFKTKKTFYSNGIIPKNLKDLIFNYNICFLSLLFKKEVFEKQKFNENFNIIGDYDLVLKIFDNYKVSYENTHVGIYNIHINNFSNRNLEMHSLELRKWFINNYIVLLDNDKMLKTPIILKYLTLINLNKLIKNNYYYLFKYLINSKKNTTFLKVLKSYFNYKFLSIV